jgi:hypothetical protein
MVTVEFGTAKFEAELDELLRIVRLLKNQLDKKHRKMLKELLLEIDKIYEIIVKATDTFVEIPFKDPKFSDDFAKNRKGFEDQYKMDKETAGFSCKRVYEELQNLLIPSEPSKFSRILKVFGWTTKQPSEVEMINLRNHIKKWYAVDKDVYGSLSSLQYDLVSGLDKINETLMKKNSEEAYSELQLFLTESRAQFDKIKKLKAKLEDVSNHL